MPRLFGLDPLGEGGWLNAVRPERYAPRGRKGVLFAYADAL